MRRVACKLCLPPWCLHVSPFVPRVFHDGDGAFCRDLNNDISSRVRDALRVVSMRTVYGDVDFDQNQQNGAKPWATVQLHTNRQFDVSSITPTVVLPVGQRSAEFEFPAAGSGE